jgi:hypothetical protein
LFEPRITYSELGCLFLILKINTKGLVTKNEYIALEMESHCRVAVIIDLTC